VSDFPIMGYWSNKLWKQIPGSSIPFAMIEPHRAQADKNHCRQTLERLAERGGLDHTEAIAVLEDRAWTPMDIDEAKAKLEQMKSEWLSKHQSIAA
jgi:hypothetical protein